jgi:hypothetical protein
MSTKTNPPDSDLTARKRQGVRDLEKSEEGAATPETSNKTGKHSSVEKLAASRPEFAAAPGAKAKPGSFGDGRAKKGREPATGSATTKGFGGRPGEVSDKVKRTKGDK